MLCISARRPFLKKKEKFLGKEKRTASCNLQDDSISTLFYTTVKDMFNRLLEVPVISVVLYKSANCHEEPAFLSLTCFFISDLDLAFIKIMKKRNKTFPSCFLDWSTKTK